MGWQHTTWLPGEFHSRCLKAPSSICAKRGTDMAKGVESLERIVFEKKKQLRTVTN